MIKDFIDPDFITNPSFFESISEIVICSICKGVLINPCECSVCQNSFCRKCLDEWTCINSSCPFKCEKSEFRDSSRTLKNLLDKLLFKCIYCSSLDKEITYPLFINHVKSCEKMQINCPTCNSVVSKKNINENKFYKKLEDNYNELSKKYKNLKEENKNLKEEVKILKKKQTDKINIIGNNSLNDINSNLNNLNLNSRRSDITSVNNLLDSNNNNNLARSENSNNNLNNNPNSEIAEIGIIDKCVHFKGNYIPIFSCCEKSFPCFICHNEIQNHEYKMSHKVVCLICKNIYSGPKCNVCNTYQIYREK